MRIGGGGHAGAGGAVTAGLRRTWSAVSLGVFFLALAWMTYADLPWYWVFVVLCGTSALGSLVKGWWRRSLVALLWGGVLAWSFLDERVGGWTALWLLLGGSIILGWLLSLIPRRSPRDPDGPPPPPPPGAGVVIEAEVRRP